MLVDLLAIKSMDNIALHSPVAPIRPNGFGRSTSSQRIYLNGKIKESLMRSQSQPSFCASKPKTDEEPKKQLKKGTRDFDEYLANSMALTQNANNPN